MKNITYLLITILLMILPWFWIPTGFVYTSEEPNFINYDIKLDQASTMWSKDNGFGAAGDPSNQSLLIPNAVFYHTLREFGLDRSNTQKMFISFTFLSIAIGFNLFSSLFTKNSLIKTFGLAVYVFNFYTVGAFGYTAKILQLILMPPIFFVTYRYLKTGAIRYLLQNFIWIFIFQGVFTNLPLAVTSLSIYFFAYLYYLFSEENWTLRNSTKSLLIFLCSLLPMLAGQFVIYRTVLDAMRDHPVLFAFSAVGTPLGLMFQTRGVWWEKSGHMSISYFPLWRFYGNLLTVISTIIGMCAILLTSVKISWESNLRMRIKSAYWLIFYLFGLGIAGGFYFFPGLYQWMMRFIPLMVMFREPWAKFIPYAVFSVSALTLIVLESLRGTNKRERVVVSAIIVLYLLIQCYPFISGKIIDSETLGWKRRLVKIPSYWEDYSQWTEENQKVILALPIGSTPFNSLYDWYPGEIGNTILPMPCALGKTNVICENNIDKYASVVRNFRSKQSFDFLKFGGVDLVLTQGDLKIISEKESFKWQAQGFNEFIQSSPIATFGGVLHLYKLKEDYIRPVIYTTQDVIVISRKTDITSLPLKDFGKNKIFIYDDMPTLGLKKSILPDISFHKNSQTKYTAKIKNAGESFILVFNQSYDPGWRILTTPLGDTPPHFIVNGFVNGWYINPRLICIESPCEINIVIEFEPQRYFFTSLIINIGLFSVALFTLLTSMIIKIIQKR